MTEPTPVQVDKPVVSQVSDVTTPGMAVGVDGTYEAGLELKARSQWSYARNRFLRHRLAMTGLVVLVIMTYWLWRLRRRRIARHVIGVPAPEAI